SRTAWRGRQIHVWPFGQICLWPGVVRKFTSSLVWPANCYVWLGVAGKFSLVAWRGRQIHVWPFGQIHLWPGVAGKFTCCLSAKFTCGLA
ncbi:hypothetical protein T484DRAFT_1627372, partial [Baffinella frigidus]